MHQDDHECLGALSGDTDSVIIRRFLTWEKAEELVSRGLRFSPASWFEDDQEGHYPGYDANRGIANHNRMVTLISCWTTGALTTPRFWLDYASQEEGIAIETTVGRLRRALGDEFLVVNVRYIDFARSRLVRDHSLRPFLYKQTSFAWEKEVRAIGEMERGSSRPLKNGSAGVIFS